MSYGNSFGRSKQATGAGRRVWQEIYHSYPVGGVVSNISDFDTIIPAGSPAIWERGSVKVLKSGASAEDLAKVNGLTHNDVYIDGANAATVNVVFAGIVYADRLEVALTDAVLAKLPEIKTIKEA